MTDVREVLRQLRLGEPARRIARELGVSRNTVAGYHRWAQTHGLLTGELPEAETLAALLRPAERARPPQEQSRVAPSQEQILAWRQRGVEGQAIFHLLVERHGFAGSYSAVKRFLRRLEPPLPRATVRIGTASGEEAQVDFVAKDPTPLRAAGRRFRERSVRRQRGGAGRTAICQAGPTC